MEKQEISSFEEAVNDLYDIPRFTEKHTVEETRAFLKKLGNPERGMRIVHVAGTNGKGSVCAYLRHILEAAGYRVAVFTSPHLVDIRERFVVDGKMISEEEFLRGFSDVRNLLDYHPTYFEFLFFIAMRIFAEKKPDFCILETGLGGRLDATNSVERKDLSVITRIGLDHMEYLGETAEEIAAEKAGILMEGVPAVCLYTSKSVAAVFDEKAQSLGTELTFVSEKDYSFLNFRNKSIDFSVNTRYYKDVRLHLSTPARYQMENAALAVRAAEVLDRGRTISAEAIQRGVRACFWQGRMEEIRPEVFLDGAHNEDGVRAFLETVSSDEWQGERHLLFSAVKDKAYAEMLARILKTRLFQQIGLIALDSDRATALEELRRTAEEKIKWEYGPTEAPPRLCCYGSVEEALGEMMPAQGAGERLYIAGSLYLVGEVKAYLGVRKP